MLLTAPLAEDDFDICQQGGELPLWTVLPEGTIYGAEAASPYTVLCCSVAKSPNLTARAFVISTNCGLVVIVVRNDVLPALEKAGVAAVVRRSVTNESVPCAVAKSVEHAVSGTTNQADRTTGQSASDEFVRSIFVAEVTSNHVGTANRAFDSILERSRWDVPNKRGRHGDQTNWEIINLILNAPIFWTLRISKASSDGGKHRHCC